MYWSEKLHPLKILSRLDFFHLFSTVHISFFCCCFIRAECCISRKHRGVDCLPGAHLLNDAIFCYRYAATKILAWCLVTGNIAFDVDSLMLMTLSFAAVSHSQWVSTFAHAPSTSAVAFIYTQWCSVSRAFF